MAEPSSPSPPSISSMNYPPSSTRSTNSSLLDIPSSIYMLEEPSVKLSTASFMTTDRPETPSDSPIAYDEIFREQSVLGRQSQSPTMLLQIRARSRSLGMMSQQSSDF